MSYKLETERRMKFLMSLDLFNKWEENDIKLLNVSSRTVELPADSVSVPSCFIHIGCSALLHLSRV